MTLRHPLLTVALLALLAVNGLLFAYGQGWLGGNPGSAQREPQRLAAQQNTDRFTLLSAEEIAAARQPLACREIGPFSDDTALQAAEAALRSKLGLGDAGWQRQQRSQPGVFLLATRAAPTEADAQRQRATLNRAGYDSLRAQALMGEPNPSWVISRHDTEAEAKAANDAAKAKNLVLLRVVTQRVPVTQQWLHLPGLTAAQAKATHPAWPGGLRTCEPEPVVEPPAPAASS